MTGPLATKGTSACSHPRRHISESTTDDRSFPRRRPGPGLASAAPASAQISTDPKVLAPFKAVVAKANESTVRVRGDDKDVALGTVVFSDGFILTKASELRGRLSVRLSDGTEYEAKIVGTHRDTDLALLQVDVKDLKPVTFSRYQEGPAGGLAGGGRPASDPTAVGIVSVATRKLTGFDAQIDNLNRGYVGIFMATNDPKDEDGKVIGEKITEVDPKGAGKKAGLLVDDIVTAVNGKVTTGRECFRNALENSHPGDTVSLTVLRDGEEKTFAHPDRFHQQTRSRRDPELNGRRSIGPGVPASPPCSRPTWSFNPRTVAGRWSISMATCSASTSPVRVVLKRGFSPARTFARCSTI